MPRLLNGRAVHGVGSTGISVDNRLIVPGGGTPDWSTATQIVGQAPLNGGPFVVVTLPPDGPARPLWDGDDRGADTICAGGGTIAAGNRGRAPFTRLQNTAGLREIPNLIPWDVDRATGTAVLVDQQEGATLRIFTRRSTAATPEASIPTGPLYSVRCLWNRVVWTEGTPSGIRPRAYDLDALRGIDLQAWPGNVRQALIVASKTGRLFLLYSTQEGGVVLHPVDDATQGHTLPDGEHFGLDAELQPDGSLLVAWCSNQGESAGSLQTITWSLDALESIAVPVDVVPRVDRAAWAGWFAFTLDAIDPPGNCGLYVGLGQDGIIRARDGTPIAQYVAATHDSDVDELEQVIAAKRGPLPVLAYWTLAAQGVRVPTADIIGIEAYRKTVETLSGFDFRLRQTAARVGRAWLIAQCYTSNATNTSDLLSLVPVYARILRDCRNIEGIIVFSGNGRATGYQDHPEVQGAWRALFASIGVPDLGTAVPDPGTPATPPDPEPLQSDQENTAPPVRTKRSATPLTVFLKRRSA